MLRSRPGHRRPADRLQGGPDAAGGACRDPAGSRAPGSLL